MAAMMKKKMVRLNVGGEIFATSSTTLLSAGESFFSSLLSGRHESERDASDAIFIDRSPKYFGPILHYLRTNKLEIPVGLSHLTLKNEAEFYGIQKIVDHLDHLDHLEREKHAKSELPKKVLPVLKDVGCYVNVDNSHAFLFGTDDKITCIEGYEAYTQALVVQSYPQVPKEWKNDQSQARSFAVFYESHVSKGTYKMNSEGKDLPSTKFSEIISSLEKRALDRVLKHSVSMNSFNAMGMILTLPGRSGSSASVRQHLATLSRDSTKLCVTSYSCSDGSGLFMCSHENPNHFHLYNLHKF